MITYQAGYINLTPGSDIVEGLGTYWNNSAKVGDTISSGAWSSSVTQVIDNHLIKVSGVYVGDLARKAEYTLEQPDSVNSFDTLNSWSLSTITANGVQQTVFGPSLPNPTTVKIKVPEGGAQISNITVTDGSISFSAQQAGDYTFTFESDTYYPYTHTITAT